MVLHIAKPSKDSILKYEKIDRINISGHLQTKSNLVRAAKTSPKKPFLFPTDF